MKKGVSLWTRIIDDPVRWESAIAGQVEEINGAVVWRGFDLLGMPF